MRMIDLIHATEDHVLAIPLFNDQGKILLSKGVKLKPSLASKLLAMGYTKVYIKDEYSEKEIEDIIKPHVRQKAIGHIRKLASIAKDDPKETANKQQAFNTDLTMAKATISTIVEEIFSKKDIVIDLLDLKTVEGYIYEHSINVMIHSLVLGSSLGLAMAELEKLALAAALHDIGLMFVSDNILKKQGPLTPEEMEEVKSHTYKGYEFLKTKTDLNPTIRIPALQHHKRYDDTGYPDLVSYHETHLFSRIISVADTFDAMTSDRPYRKALPVAEVLEYIMGSGGTLFHPTLTKAFILHINPYPINTLVKLNDGSTGVVIQVNGRFYSRPVVRLVMDQYQKKINQTVNLLENRTLVIQSTVSKI
ncbi:metal dependent phosphohydrolase [Clostridium aceticum]|uniref:Metal dependent phosphohydrolase n=1 Tax=Clostridium aceticum TaxID=84022 RepID=A0A0G3WER0_9CLOT|nr:HD domain-containing phosphohydrolase [Clostridium aceticum]AKL97116.1 metal dependent phosphohydrolase [Clostridium aceticum]